jgi:hypothetical protein
MQNQIINQQIELIGLMNINPFDKAALIRFVSNAYAAGLIDGKIEMTDKAIEMLTKITNGDK